MQPFQSRVIAERNELAEKIAKLTTFIQEGTYQSLPSDERGRLANQLAVMEEYCRILDARILAFGSLDFEFTINGKAHKTSECRLSYEQIAGMAGFPDGATPTCTYSRVNGNRSGILLSGDTVPIVGGEHFDIVYTGNA